MIIGTTTTDGVTKVKTKTTDGVVKAVSCACCGCEDEWLVVDFSTDPNSSGRICAPGFGFQDDECWCEGSAYDNPLDSSGRQHIVINMGLSRCDGVWTSSVNFTVMAQWETECEFGTYPDPVTGACDPLETTTGDLTVTYKGVTKTASMTLIRANLGSDCSTFDVDPVITVYAAALGDGSYFEIT